MREIKFRAWDNKNKWMDNDFYLSSCGSVFDLPDRTYDTPNTEIQHTSELKVMQYTGLKDNSGIEVYEGDIIEHYQNTFDVYYDESDAAFALGCGGYQEMRLCDVSNSLIKVIGNIYENPELLKD